MKLYAPEYYGDFACIADRCRHSCCIGWEIDIDPVTMEKYASFSERTENGYVKDIIKSIDFDETPHFRLDGDVCPHLDERGLCRIIKNVGEDALCDICREHPRFYNDTPLGKEVGVGMSCEEACRLILSSDGYDRIMAIADIDGDVREMEIDPLPYREKIYSILRDKRLSYPVKLEIIYAESKVSPTKLSDGEWNEVISSLEYLDEKDRVLFDGYSSSRETPQEIEKYLERALAYFIYRHCAEAGSEDELRASLGFCFFAERLLASAAKNHGCYGFDEFAELARTVSEEIEYSEENTDSVKIEYMF